MHYGHLRLAADVRGALSLPEVRLIPAGDPPHRDAPRARAADRVAMLELAIREFPGLTIDTREIDRKGKSYTVDTLAGLRHEMPAHPLLLLVGADAFRGLPAWHQWMRLFDLAHVVVVPRPDVELDTALPTALEVVWHARATRDPQVLRDHAAGSIYVQPVTAQPISASAIRAALARGDARSVEIAGLLPASVLAYIESHNLYTQSPNAF